MANKKEKQEKREWSWYSGRSQSWVPGVVLILIGVVFLLRNYFPEYSLDNWWALFILLPAMSSFTRAVEIYRKDGFNRSARSSVFWGLFFTLLSASFLFSLNFALIWPAFLIIGGLAMLLGAF
ncbi:MAG TPA: hypothetical protein VF982_02115 [Anaerolineales bacterium]